MTGKGHFVSGFIFSIFTYKYTYDIGGTALIGAIGTILGATAPDYLEIRKKVYNNVNGKQKCVGTKTLIEHRTITHWLPLWILLFLFSYLNINKNLENNYLLFLNNYLEFSFNYSIYLYSLLLGYSIGGLLHLLVDIPNPMGIPILTPKKRFSLNLWRSGKMEPLILTVIALFCLYYVDLINFNIEALVNFKDHLIKEKL